MVRRPRFSRRAPAGLFLTRFARLWDGMGRCGGVRVESLHTNLTIHTRVQIVWRGESRWCGAPALMCGGLRGHRAGGVAAAELKRHHDALGRAALEERLDFLCKDVALDGTVLLHGGDLKGRHPG